MLVINLFKNNTPIKKKVFAYLIIFISLILILLWAFQVVFLNTYYENYKTNELEQSLNDIKEKYNGNIEDISNTLETFSFNNGICSEITVNGMVIYTTNLQNRGCLNIYDAKNSIYRQKINFLNSTDDTMRLRVINPKLNNKILLYGIKFNDNTAIFINTSIDPIDSTVTVLKNQLLIITFILIILAIIIAYFISNKLSKPLISITDKAKKISKGDFNVNFETSTDIKEIGELANTLNYAKDVLKKNDELRRDLLANVSHDLKTPLTMIKAYAEKVKDLTYNNKEKRENDLNVIVEEVDRLNLLVNDILNLSKLESNIDKLKMEKFNLSNLIDTIVKRFKIFSITQEYEFICKYPNNIIINADKQKIEQVIYNLVSNALNYSNKKVYINILKRKENIRVLITDTGSGIDKKDIVNIWDKYYQADKNHKRNMIGTGLGLSIVKNILNLHNYKYGIVSKKNIGTTFYFEIKKSNE